MSWEQDYAKERRKARIQGVINGGKGNGAGNGFDDEFIGLTDLKSFMDAVEPPDWVIDGVIQRGYLYSLTAPTSHGKTAVIALMAMMCAANRRIGPIETFGTGQIVMLCGENPQDFNFRCHATCKDNGLDPATLPISVFPYARQLDETEISALAMMINQLGDVRIIFVDTVAAYFDGDDDNSNVQIGNFFRLLRKLCKCNGRPSVIALAHPTKYATGKEMLLPRGGGAALNEVDGNLTLWREGDANVTTLHWVGKIRGCDFEPVSFSLVPVQLDMVDRQGRPVTTVAARPMDDAQIERAEEKQNADQITVLEHVRRNPDGVTVRRLAETIGWAKSKVGRVSKTLKDGKFIADSPAGFTLTPVGKRLLERRQAQP